jgi:hypothetical protein
VQEHSTATGLITPSTDCGEQANALRTKRADCFVGMLLPRRHPNATRLSVTGQHVGLRDYGTKSHTRFVAEQWCPAVGKTRRHRPPTTNRGGKPEGATTPLAMLNKHGL